MIYYYIDNTYILEKKMEEEKVSKIDIDNNPKPIITKKMMKYSMMNMENYYTRPMKNLN